MHDIPATPGGMPATPGGMPLLTAEQVADYRETFNLYDKNGDGEVAQGALHPDTFFPGPNLHTHISSSAGYGGAVCCRKEVLNK